MRRCGDQRAPAVVVRTVELCPALWGGPIEVGEASGSEYCEGESKTVKVVWYGKISDIKALLIISGLTRKKNGREQ